MVFEGHLLRVSPHRGLAWREVAGQNWPMSVAKVKDVSFPYSGGGRWVSVRIQTESDAALECQIRREYATQLG